MRAWNHVAVHTSGVPRVIEDARSCVAVARKVDMLDYADRLSDLASPPGNRLEALKGDLLGFHGIRINDRWRMVFRWTDAGPTGVDVRDDH